jgi:outer membrane protein assembly factor BamB
VEVGPETNVKWKVATPEGLSSPIIVGDLIVLTAFEDNKLFTIAYHAADGSEAWRADAGAGEIEKYYKGEGSPAASTPATDGSRIVAYFGSCGLRCYDLEGHELWRFEVEPPLLPGNFGSGVSPILQDDTVVLVRDQARGSKIFGIDAESGDLKWEQSRYSPVSYCTPVIWEAAGQTQVVAAGHARMVSYDLASGEELWSITGLPSGCCASPVATEEWLYFAGFSPGGPEDEFQMPSFDEQLTAMDKDQDGQLSRAEAGEQMQGFFDTQDSNQDGTITREEHENIEKFIKEGKSSAFAVKPGGSGDITESHIAWKQMKNVPYVPSAILYEGQYVSVKDGGIVISYDAESGEQVYMKRGVAPGRYYASPVAANGHIYFVTLEDGVVTVIKAGGTEPKEVAQNPPLGERVSATPAIAEDVLYIRTHGHLYAFEKE